MEELLQLLNDFHPLSPELVVTLLKRFTKEVHRKNKRILEAGQICDWIAFVEKGLVKLSYEPEDGTERVAGFHREGEVIGPVDSFFANTPSALGIQAIDETHLRKIRKIELEFICRKYPELYLHLLKILDDKYCKLEEHSRLLMEPAKKRFPLVQKQEPWLLQDARIKDYMLAAYLGIDKATFSRFRNGRGTRND